MTKDEIRAALEKARRAGMTTHLLIIDDVHEHSYFAASVKLDDNVEAVIASWDPPLKVIEVYALHLDIEAQLAEKRAWHTDPAPPDARARGYVRLAKEEIAEVANSDERALLTAALAAELLA